MQAVQENNEYEVFDVQGNDYSNSPNINPVKSSFEFRKNSNYNMDIVTNQIHQANKFYENSDIYGMQHQVGSP